MSDDVFTVPLTRDWVSTPITVLTVLGVCSTSSTRCGTTL
jgi:hypothetical protein